jgi:hypothetical protein
LPDEWMDNIPRLSIHGKSKGSLSSENIPASIRRSHSVSLRKRPSSASALSRSKSFLSGKPLDTFILSQIRQERLAVSRPLSVPKTFLSKSDISVETSNINENNRKISQEQTETQDTKQAPKYGAKDYVWLLTLKIPSVHQIDSNMDDSWIMSYELFNVIRRKHESFHIFSNGPLVFNVEEEYLFICTEESLINFFIRERLFKIVFTPKFSCEDQHIAAFDLRQLQKSLTIEQEVPVQKVRSDEIYDNKLIEEEDFDDTQEESEGDSDEIENSVGLESNSKAKVYINIRKLGKILEMEKDAIDDIIQEYIVPEFNIIILKGKPFHTQPRKTSLRLPLNANTK